MGFFIGVLLIYNLLLFYIGWNGWKWLKTLVGNKRWLKAAYWPILFIFSYSFIFGRWADESPLLTWTGGIWLGVFYFCILLLPLVNLFVFLTRFTKMPREKVIKWSGFVTLAVMVCLFIVGVYNAYSPVVRNYQINIPKMVEGKRNLKIVVAADTHFSEMSGASHAKNLVKRINALQPDVVLFPGDIIDDNVKPFLDKGIPDILKQIKAPVYASLGNHDREKAGVDLIQIFNNSGMKALDDEVIGLENGITLVGRKDRGYQDVARAKLEDLMEQVDPAKPVILLDHQPYDLDIAQNNGIDLMVSGHTHRGQIFPANLITNMLYENDWGYLKKGQMQSIVTSGYGFWGTPLRIGTRSEIVMLNVSFQ